MATTQHDHLGHRRGQRQHHTERGTLAAACGGFNAPAQSVHLRAHHIHANATARQACHLCGRRKTGHEDELRGLVFAQHGIGIDEPLGQRFRTNTLQIQTGAIVAERHRNVIAFVVQFDRDGARRPLAMGDAIPIQAKKLGAKVFVHYSFPRHMSQVLLSSRRELMKKKCAELGLEFVDATAPDPTGDSGLPGAQQFILEDVPKMVAKYGKDTAFFSTNCAMQIPLIKSVVDTGAIYPQPCCPSPYHGFPTALGIESDLSKQDNIKHVIDETRRILKEKGMTGRLSTWPVPVAMMGTVAGTEYAFKVIDGEVPFDKLDVKVLEQCMSDYAKVAVETNPYVDEAGKKYDNFLFVLMDFLTY